MLCFVLPKKLCTALLQNPMTLRDLNTTHSPRQAFHKTCKVDGKHCDFEATRRKLIKLAETYTIPALNSI